MTPDTEKVSDNPNLESADSSGSDFNPMAEVSERPTRRMWIAALVSVAIIGSAIWLVTPPRRPVLRYDYTLDEGLEFRAPNRVAIVASPDGRRVVYNTSAGLYLLSLDDLEARLIPGTEDFVDNLTFSPDGRWIAYWAPGQLRKISIYGGEPVVITDVMANPIGLSWAEDDTLIYSELGVLMRVAADGGTPKPVLGRPGVFPSMLPGGDAVLFNAEATRIAIESLDGTSSVPPVPGLGAQYLSTGHIVYAVGGSLYAQAFDLKNLKIIGGPVPVVEGVLSPPPQYAVSDSGTLVYIPGPSGFPQRPLVWVDRDGVEEVVNADARTYFYPRISPDGRRAALDIRGTEENVWILDFRRGALSRSTLAPEPDNAPIWAPDGRRVTFASRRGEGNGIYWESPDDAGSILPLFREDDGRETVRVPYFFTPSGQYLVFGEQNHPETGDNIGILSLAGGTRVEWLVATEANERNAELSPDGRWIAYQSDESGRSEIYVSPFPNVDDQRWQVSREGGRDPLWSPLPRELFYLEDGPETTLMVVAVDTRDEFRFESPEALLDWPYYMGGAGRNYDVTPDGRRFLVVRNVTVNPPGSDTTPKVNIVLNWHQELLERVPRP